MHATPIDDHASDTHTLGEHDAPLSEEQPVTRPRVEKAISGRRIDDELIERIALGDVTAGEELKARHERRLRAIAFRLLGDETEAERIVEVALEDACRGWPPERGHVAKWLREIVQSRAQARVRALGAWDL